MAMTPEMQAKIMGIISHAEAMEYYSDRGCDFVNAGKHLRDYAAHLSAQAKVRVTEPESAGVLLDEYRIAVKERSDALGGLPLTRQEDVACMRAALDKCGFAARLSQGAQGEAVAKLDKPALVGHTQFGVGIPWSTVIGAAQRAYEWKDDKMSPEQIAAFYIAFPHLAPSHEKVMQSAERSAVPEGFVLVPREPTQEMLNAARDWSLRVNGIGVGHSQATGCYQAMLTAAPQPPEGARVVIDLRAVNGDDIEAMMAAAQSVAKAPRDMPIRRMEAAAFALYERLARRLCARWLPIETAPKDRTILLWGEVDGGERGAAYTAVMAHWCSDKGLFGEDGGWLVSFTDDCVASIENPTRWMPCPSDPETI